MVLIKDLYISIDNLKLAFEFSMTSIIKKVSLAYRLKQASLPREAVYVLFPQSENNFDQIKFFKYTPKDIKTLLSDTLSYWDYSELTGPNFRILSEISKAIVSLNARPDTWYSDAPFDQLYDLFFDKSRLKNDFSEAKNPLGPPHFTFGPFHPSFIKQIPLLLINKEAQTMTAEGAVSTMFEKKFSSHPHLDVKIIKSGVSLLNGSKPILSYWGLVDVTNPKDYLIPFNIEEVESFFRQLNLWSFAFFIMSGDPDCKIENQKQISEHTYRILVRSNCSLNLK